MHGHEFCTIKLIKNINGSVVEIGSSRGSKSTVWLSKIANELGKDFYTVDIMEESRNNAIEDLKKNDLKGNCILSDGVKFLRDFNEKICFLYLDAWDIVTSHPHKKETINQYRKYNLDLSNKASHEFHLNCCKEIINKIEKGGFICLDDTWEINKDEYDGKGKTSIKFLEDNGFKIYKKSNNFISLIRK